jgi:hypothetical protein
MFIPRHPVVEDQFCQFATSTGTVSTAGAGGVLAYAGSVCYLDDSQNESIVTIYVADEDKMPFGFLMQKVKVGYHSIHPAGFMMPGDLGSSDVIAQPSYNSSGVINGSKAAPVGVAHLGIWDTIHYTNADTVITAGMALKVVQSSLSELGGTAATVNDTSNGATVVARVVKGASAAQVAANAANTTLFPIRVKLLV